MDSNQTPLAKHFPTGKKEVITALILLLICVFLADFMVYGGLNLGFALTCIGCILCSFLYLFKSGCRPTGYSTSLLILSMVLSASLIRADDLLVEMMVLLFLILSSNLGLTLMAAKNRRAPDGVTSLLDAPMAIFTLGVGELPNSFGGLSDARKNAGDVGKKGMAVLGGLAVAIPVLLILIPLLMRSDAAFEGLIHLFPEMDLAEPILALFLGFPLACVLYTRNTALKHKEKAAPGISSIKAVSPWTINTVLILVAVVYLMYLFSQLAYFVGGFCGILPTEFTMAEYARRGFFEMAWLCAINLAIITLSVGICGRTDGKLSGLTKALCLFIGLVSLFLTFSASAKMMLYIASYGLTRLRVLTEIIIVFLALTVVYVLIWLFAPKFPYMKVIMITALLICAITAWVDVDTMVAAYNVRAYQAGALSSVDVSYLCKLGHGAVPYLQDLTSGNYGDTSLAASRALASWRSDLPDFRSWNIAAAIAEKILEFYQ